MLTNTYCLLVELGSELGLGLDLLSVSVG